MFNSSAKSVVELILKGKDQASGAFDAVTGRVGKLGGVLSKGLAAGATGAVAGLAAVGTGALLLAKNAEPIAGIRDAFKALTGDVEGGSAAMMAALQESSSGFVTNTGLMTSFNKAAQLVSVDFAKELPGAMKALGKVSAATGDDMGFLLDSLVTGIGRLSPMILDNLGIQVDLTQAYEDYADSVGKTVDELSKQEQQAALTQQVLTLLEANTADMAGPQGGFAQFGVALANLKDSVGVALLPAFQPVMGVLTDLTNNLLPPVADWIGVFIPNAIDLLGGFWTGTLQPMFQEVGGVLSSELGPGLDSIRAALGDALPLAIDILNTYWESILKPQLQFLWDFTITYLIPALGDLFSWIGKNLPGAIATLQTIWENWLKPAMQAYGDFLVNVLFPALNTLFDWLQTNIPDAVQTVSDFWNNTLYPALETTWEFIDQNIIPVLKTAWEWLSEEIPPAVTAVATAFSTGWETVSGAVQGAWDVVGDIFEKIKAFGDWLAGHVFKFKVNLPELPDWAVPGSPIPLHTAWKDFGQFMTNADFTPKMDFNQVAPLARSGRLASATAPVSGPTYLTINVTDQSTGEQLLRLVRELQRNAIVVQ